MGSCKHFSLNLLIILALCLNHAHCVHKSITLGSFTPKSFTLTSADGIAVTGQTNTSPSDINVIVVDSRGNKLWENTYGGSQEDIGNSIVQTSDNEFIIAGSTRSFGAGSSDAYILKVTSTGTLSWNATYGTSSADSLNSIIKTNDNFLAACGTSLSSSGNGNDYWLVKIDYNGVKDWESTYAFSGNNGANSLAQNSEGSYILVGESSGFTSAAGNIVIIITTSTGSLFRVLYLDSTNQYVLKGVVPSADDGFVMIGTITEPSVSNAWVRKIDKYGIVAWDQAFTMGTYTSGNAIAKIADENFVIKGQTLADDGTVTVWVLIMDAYGNRQSSQIFPLLEEDKCGSVVQQSKTKNFTIVVNSNDVATMIIASPNEFLGKYKDNSFGAKYFGWFSTYDWWVWTLIFAGGALGIFLFFWCCCKCCCGQSDDEKNNAQSQRSKAQQNTKKITPEPSNPQTQNLSPNFFMQMALRQEARDSGKTMPMIMPTKNKQSTKYMMIAPPQNTMPQQKPAIPLQKKPTLIQPSPMMPQQKPGFPMQNQGFPIQNQGFTIQNQGFPMQNQGFTIQNQGMSPQNKPPPQQKPSPPVQISGIFVKNQGSPQAKSYIQMQSPVNIQPNQGMPQQKFGFIIQKPIIPPQQNPAPKPILRPSVSLAKQTTALNNKIPQRIDTEGTEAPLYGDEENTSARDTPPKPDSNFCMMDRKNKCDMVFIPCGHICACHSCGEKLKQCPQCKLQIKRSMRILIE